MGAQPGQIMSGDSKQQATRRWWRPALCVIGGAAGAGVALAVVASMAAASPHAAAKSSSGVTLCATKGGAVVYEKSGKCPKHDKTLSVGSQGAVKKLQKQVASLRTEVSSLQRTLQGVTRAKLHGEETLTIAGENVQLVNGTGDEASLDGLGNLIIGYNDNPDALDRSGSHNLVVGDDNGYSSYGGIVAGYGNLISGIDASDIGGFGNTSTGQYASVTGGTDNSASGMWSTVSGGATNTASGDEASVTGGMVNIAGGNGSAILGGYNGTISTNDCASIPTNHNTSAQCG
jgi:hypothetical protein